MVSNALAAVINGLSTLAPWLVPTIVGVFLPFLVMTGTHHALTPIGINNRMTIGFDTIILSGSADLQRGTGRCCWPFPSRPRTRTQAADLATGITAVCGITEQVLFGVSMKIRTNMIAAMAGGGVGLFFMGLMNTKNYSGGSPGLSDPAQLHWTGYPHVQLLLCLRRCSHCLCGGLYRLVRPVP